MEKSIPWIEKYRPKNLEDIMLDAKILTQINAFMTNTSGIHLIITGAPGLGKTTTVKCIAKKILGPHISDGYLELNAAEDRGVRSISSIIPPFCKKVVNFAEHRIILLDEADNLTSKCQFDISSMVKQFGHKTKFIFTCNDSNKISEDIQSVCRIIQFKPMTDEQINAYLIKICDMEHIPYQRGGLEILCHISGGDMRKAINNLQLTAYSYQNITKGFVLKVCKLPDPDEIVKIIGLCIKGDLAAACTLLEDIMDNGYCYLDIVTSFIYVLTPYKIAEDRKLQMVDIVQQTKILVSSGIRSKLQLTAMVSRLVRLFIEPVGTRVPHALPLRVESK